MWIATPDSKVFSLIDLCTYVGLEIIPHDGEKPYQLVAYTNVQEGNGYVCIKTGDYLELEVLLRVIASTGTDTRFAPTTPTLH